MSKRGNLRRKIVQLRVQLQVVESKENIKVGKDFTGR